MAKNFLIIALLVFLVVFIYQVFFNHPPLNTVSLKLKNQDFQVEVAKTIPQKTLGLGNRPTLCQNCGMIFVWDQEIPLAFWMKDTLIPLDMIFINKDGRVINVATAPVQPDVPDSELIHYTSLAPSQFVLELNAGTSQRLNLVAGDTIDLSVIK